MIKLGQYNHLRISRFVDFGCYLVDKADEEEILLPRKYIPENASEDDVIEVFVYTDSEDRRIATTEKPKAVVGEIAFLTVVDTSTVGAFLDWGLAKDLLVPFREQQDELSVGQSVPVYIYIDSSTDRIVATTRINRRLKDKGKFEKGQEVDMMIYQENEFGYMAVVNGTHRAMLYQNDLYKDVFLGFKSKAYIKHIREDGKIDISLQRYGFAKVQDEVDRILMILHEHDGFIEVTDKSKPELIKSIFGISKNVYKKSVGMLYKQGKIKLEKNGIRLVDDDQ